MSDKTYILGIESSCDETAAAVLEYDGVRPVVLSNVIASQISEHKPYGGVVPEIAARSHVEKIDEVIEHALLQSGIKLDEIDAVAATSGPGLIGGVIVGMLAAKGICIGANKPFVAVNHLEGHALSPRLNNDVAFPYLLLLVSGGHCQILRVDGVGQYSRLGSTIDDALGEAFDKVAKILGLGYPGGPLVEARAKLGNAKAFELPRPLIGRAGCDFSFAGLKTAVLRLCEKIYDEKGALSDDDINDICASFQYTIIRVLKDRLKNAFAACEFAENNRRLVIAGGVAANQKIRGELSDFCGDMGWQIFYPELKYCGDNGAMIALVGLEYFNSGISHPLATKPKPRWPLDADAAPLQIKNGYGKKGAKA
ncbi:tRNA (adenosine(37)-N6)-threonylcarbamoyltransferase complex transferase subunit TsaD [Pseudaquidulcibacter saccharophilus]|uniref:tRNA (adenosine(37)-N6)-threonylcarbamoyltransferase complex transferase subunit TsaD n=1 Tax=Pseudaquidulcibacter saccharophilus TaxID=2831900 RepID=UPI001EFF39BF|nr:tRNA (adenosine(37)-N6)-threonylcarbamoyltransferase complex transferase subunit TsaD [Pseudaquidulcibacter saccharophilus]